MTRIALIALMLLCLLMTTTNGGEPKDALQGVWIAQSMEADCHLSG